MNNDMGNAAFEFGGACLNLLSIRALLRDKMVRGFSPAPLVFFTAWGFWNLFYYPALSQQWSWVAGMFLVATNTVNVALIWKYRNV